MSLLHNCHKQCLLSGVPCHFWIDQINGSRQRAVSQQDAANDFNFKL